MDEAGIFGVQQLIFVMEKTQKEQEIEKQRALVENFPVFKSSFLNNHALKHVYYKSKPSSTIPAYQLCFIVSRSQKKQS